MPSQGSRPPVGISGFAACLPRYRVDLEAWCRWTGDNWSKVSTVIGSSFRMRAPNENAYTLAAGAVLRLIRRYDIDPGRVGYLALGTESSTDNAVGAIIVRGMIDDALRAEGSRPLSRHCEVPEFKHACLGGVYALKAAARYVALDGADRVAIVVCADIAEYARGSSGEATQGAGAVAMLIEAQPRLLEIDLARTGSASTYRVADFRKPMSRFASQQPSAHGQLRDFPVFNGKYSTHCYLDATLAATADLLAKAAAGGEPLRLDAIAAAFLHRPYRRMAHTAFAASNLLALAQGDAADRDTLARLADAVDVAPATLAAELRDRPSCEGAGCSPGDDAFLASTQDMVRKLRERADHRETVLGKLRLGDAAMSHCGNLYTASLPGWLAAGLDEAADGDVPLDGASVLAFGYGSGDAAEIIPLRVVDGWEGFARRIEFGAALDGAIDLDQAQYEHLHDALALDAPLPERSSTFVIDRVGSAHGALDDRGIEYYRFVR